MGGSPIKPSYWLGNRRLSDGVNLGTSKTKPPRRTAQGLVSGEFRIVPDTESYPYFTCILEGPDKLALRCGSIRDALEAAEALAEGMDDEDDDEDDEDDGDDGDDEDGTLSFLPPNIAARERARRRR